MWYLSSQRVKRDRDSNMSHCQAQSPPFPPIPCCSFSLLSTTCVFQPQYKVMTHFGLGGEGQVGGVGLGGRKVDPPIVSLRVGRSFLPHQEAHQKVRKNGAR